MTADFGFDILQLLVTFVVALLGSAGFWAILGKRKTEKDLTRKLLIGLAHDRIVYLCLTYIERGSITQDEYENLAVFLYRPYLDIGGNGSAVRLMAEVDKLPISHVSPKPMGVTQHIQKDLKGNQDHVHGQ